MLTFGMFPFSLFSKDSPLVVERILCICNYLFCFLFFYLTLQEKKIFSLSCQNT